jgi:hypothetical protein
MKNGAANDNAASQDHSAERGLAASPMGPCSDRDDIAVAAVELVFPGPALCGLADDLRKIFRAPFPGDRDSIWCQQRQYVAALEKIALFCKHSGIGADVAERFAQLAIAFDDLQAGIDGPAIFQKKKSAGGRPPDRFNTWSVRTTAMLGLECCISGNLTPEHAATRASKKFPDLAKLSTRKARPSEKWKRGAGHDLARLLLLWLTAYRDKTIPNAAAQSSFDAQLSPLRERLARRSLAERIVVGDRMLGSAAAAARRLGGQGILPP